MYFGSCQCLHVIHKSNYYGLKYIQRLIILTLFNLLLLLLLLLLLELMGEHSGFFFFFFLLGVGGGGRGEAVQGVTRSLV